MHKTAASSHVSQEKEFEATMSFIPQTQQLEIGLFPNSMHIIYYIISIQWLLT